MLFTTKPSLWPPSLTPFINPGSHYVVLPGHTDSYPDAGESSVLSLASRHSKRENGFPVSCLGSPAGSAGVALRFQLWLPLGSITYNQSPEPLTDFLHHHSVVHCYVNSQGAPCVEYSQFPTESENTPMSLLRHGHHTTALTVEAASKLKLRICPNSTG